MGKAISKILIFSSICAFSFYDYFKDYSFSQPPPKDKLEIISSRSYLHSLQELSNSLDFYKGIKNYSKAEIPLNEAKSFIKKHEENLVFWETFYLESCFLTLKTDPLLDECERLLYKGLDNIPQTWKIPIVMGMISAFKYQNLEKASEFFNVALSKPSIPKNLKLFPIFDSNSLAQNSLGLRIKSLLKQAAKDSTIQKYRLSLKKVIITKGRSDESPSNGNQEYRETL